MPVNILVHMPWSVTALADMILEENPEAVLTHTPVDPNIEHFAVCRLVISAYDRAAKSVSKN